MKKNPLRIIALLLLVIYSGMAVRSIAPFASKSESPVRTVIMECSGDCSRCGCAPERTASRTCCCWQKKMNRQCAGDGEHEECGMDANDHAKAPTIAILPCGSKTTVAFWGDNGDQLLQDQIIPPIILVEKNLACSRPKQLSSCYREPPDKPPKLSSLS